jgi:RHS repeat-associated protein
VVEYRYDAWGKLLATIGSMAATLGKYNPFRYRGYIYDEETGLYDVFSRYYNPEFGRWILIWIGVVKMNSIFEFMLKVGENVKLYIGDGDLHALHHLISGYYLCLQPSPDSKEEVEMRQFSEYVHRYFGNSRTISACDCVSEHTATREEAFDTFFLLLHKFIEETKNTDP